MNFAELYSIAAEIQYDEIKTIGKTLKSNGDECHIAAMLRQGETGQLCVLTQAEPGQALSGQRKIMRDILREQAQLKEMPGIQAVRLGNRLWETGNGTGYYLETSGTYAMVLMLRLLEAGWQLPEDSAFYETDWAHLMMTVYNFRDPIKQLPEWKEAGSSILWGPQFVQYMLEKPVELAVDKTDVAVNEGRELPFTIIGEDGTEQEGICYINRVELVDVWKEQEMRYANPDYQKRALEKVTQAQFEEIKSQSFRALEQDCPRGMCYAGVEYECTLDVSLDFYSREYLASEQKVYEGSAVFMLTSCRPSKEQGSHGLKLRAAAIRTPMPPDTVSIQAELFSARHIIPTHEEPIG